MTQNQIANSTQLLLNKLSRRHALSCFGAGGFATAFVLGSNTIAKPVDKDDYASKIVKAWVNAYNQNNPIFQASLYTNDGIYEDVPNNFQIKGTSHIQCFLENSQKVFGDLKLELQHVLAHNDYAVAEYLLSAKNTGFIPDPKIIGKSFQVRTVTVFVIKDDKIERSSDYYDNATALAQLGVIQPLPPATSLTANCQ